MHPHSDNYIHVCIEKDDDGVVEICEIHMMMLSYSSTKVQNTHPHSKNCIHICLQISCFDHVCKSRAGFGVGLEDGIILLAHTKVLPSHLVQF